MATLTFNLRDVTNGLVTNERVYARLVNEAGVMVRGYVGDSSVVFGEASALPNEDGDVVLDLIPSAQVEEASGYRLMAGSWYVDIVKGAGAETLADCRVTTLDPPQPITLGTASAVAYSPAVPADWDTDPETVAEGLDEIAAREGGGGGGGAVDSVNGQVGVVVLDAGDVGADPAGSASTVGSAAAGALTAHEADTTLVHGIADTSALATTSGVSGAISAHAVASDPHGDRAYAAGLVDDLSGVSNQSGARTNLGLGTAATQASSAFDAAGTAAALVDDLSGVTNAPTARTNLGLGTMATEDASDWRAHTDVLVNGEGPFRRGEVASVTVSTGSGFLRLAYLDAMKSETITQVRLWSGNTAAGATPTLVRVGIWTADDAGALTALVASTANDTTLLATMNQEYTKALQASFSKVKGQRYAIGLLVVTGATAPTMTGSTFGAHAGISALQPVPCMTLSGQTDLPSTVASGSLTPGLNRPYIVMLP